MKLFLLLSAALRSNGVVMMLIVSSISLNTFSLITMQIFADQIHFKQGGSFRGQFTQTKGLSRIETPSGITVEVEQPDIIKVIQTSTSQDEYLRLLRLTPLTTQAQWELGEWCRQNGMSSKRLIHMEEILKLDPDHEKAHLALGHIREKGAWIDRDKKMLEQGYVKYRGRYITEEEHELLKEAEIANSQERSWYPKIRLWVNWLDSSNQTRIFEGKELLSKVTDPHAVKPLSKFLGNHNNSDYRISYVEILANINDLVASEYLAHQAVLDNDSRVRNYAIEKIMLGRQQAAMPIIVEYLKNETNLVIRKAAVALSKIGGSEVVPKLIEALVTSHQYLVQVPVPSVSSGSSNTTSAGTITGLPPDIERNLLTGQYPNGIVINQFTPPTPMKTISVRLEQQNPEVRDALVALTGHDYGFQESTWKSWWLTSQQKAGK